MLAQEPTSTVDRPHFRIVPNPVDVGENGRTATDYGNPPAQSFLLRDHGEAATLALLLVSQDLLPINRWNTHERQFPH